MSIFSQIFSSGASTLVDSVGKVLDNVITTKEEKQNLDNELRKSEQQFQLEMRKLNLQEQQAILGDMSNARGREVQISTSEHTTKLNKNLMPYLAIGTIGLVFSIFYIMIFKPSIIAGEGKELAMYLLGILSAVMTQIYSYYFGSSAGSADKAKTINTLSSK